MYKTRHNSIDFSDNRRFNIMICIKWRYVFWSQHRAQRQWQLNNKLVISNLFKGLYTFSV